MHLDKSDILISNFQIGSYNSVRLHHKKYFLEPSKDNRTPDCVLESAQDCWWCSHDKNLLGLFFKTESKVWELSSVLGMELSYLRQAKGAGSILLKLKLTPPADSDSEQILLFEGYTEPALEWFRACLQAARKIYPGPIQEIDLGYNA